VPAAARKTTDLTQYTTEIAVDDLEQVRQRLGYGRSISTAPRMDPRSRRSTCVAIRTASARSP
jgi:hypothetical protein